jgi:hypothetical protein
VQRDSGQVRTLAIPLRVKQGINAWMIAAKIEDGRLLRPLSKSGKLIGDALGDWAVWSVVEQSWIGSEFDSDSVIDCRMDALLTAQIPFCRLYGHMTQQELDLLEFAAGRMAEPSARTTQIVGSQPIDSSSEPGP